MVKRNYYVYIARSVGNALALICNTRHNSRMVDVAININVNSYQGKNKTKVQTEEPFCQLKARSDLVTFRRRLRYG